MLAIRLDADTEARLTDLAKRTGRTKTFYAKQAILGHLDDLEDTYLAEQEIIALRAVDLLPVLKNGDSYGVQATA